MPLLYTKIKTSALKIFNSMFSTLSAVPFGSFSPKNPGVRASVEPLQRKIATNPYRLWECSYLTKPSFRQWRHIGRGNTVRAVRMPHNSRSYCYFRRLFFSLPLQWRGVILFQVPWQGDTVYWFDIYLADWGISFDL